MATPRPPGKKGPPAHLASLAGVLLLLFCCFVLLLSLSQFSRVKFDKAASSLREAFGGGRNPPVPVRLLDPLPGGTAFQQELALVHLKERLAHLLSGLLNSGEAELVETEQGLLLRLDDSILFESSTFVLRDDIKPVLQQVARLLAALPNLIRVVGHTDDQPPPSGTPLPDNWSRSALYATALVHFLATEGGLDPRRLEASGMGQYAPRADNGSAEGRSRNQRIEMIATRETLPAMALHAIGKPPAWQANPPAAFSPAFKQ